MKFCSKCQRELEESQFVNSPRYNDGKHPHCLDCRRKYRKARLEVNPLCSKCGVKPHQPKHPYCYDCQRDSKGYTKPPKFRRDSSNDYWCSKCKKEPRTPYHNYCIACKRKSLTDWLKSRRGVPVPDEVRRKKTARHYVNGLLKRGKIKRKPCEYCGAPSANFHHLDYKDRTRNVEHVCELCHLKLERQKRAVDKFLTSQLLVSHSLIALDTGTDWKTTYWLRM